MLHPRFVLLGKDLAEKVGNHFARIAYLRVGKLGVVPGVSLEQQKKRSEARLAVMLLTRTAGAQGVFASLRKRRGVQKGLLFYQDLCSVKFSCRKKNEIDVNLFLPENIVYSC